jgi:hypothetical protein
MPEEEENEELLINLWRLKLDKQTRIHVPSKVIANVDRRKNWAIMAQLRSKKNITMNQALGFMNIIYSKYWQTQKTYVCKTALSGYL